MSAVLTLALKDLRLLWRDRFGLFWVIAFPLLMALFFGSIFSGQGGSARNLKVAFVGDLGQESQAFHDALAASEALSVVRLPMDSARGLVARGKLTAYVQFAPDTSGGFGLFSAGRPSIEVGIDPSRTAEAGFLQGIVTQAYFQRMKSQMSDLTQTRGSIDRQMALLDTASDVSPDEAEIYRKFLGSLDTLLASAETGSSDSGSVNEADNYSPFQDPDIAFVNVIKERSGPRSSWEITFPQSLQWCLIGCAAAFALSIVVERTRGTLLRLRVAPISRAHILAGKGLACFIACFGISSLLLLFGILVFDVRVGSWPLLVLALASAAIAFVGIMMLISVLGKTEQAVGGAGWAVLLVFSMTGGGMIPLMAMPDWMVTVSHISPVKWSVLALEGAIWRDFGLTDMMLPVGLLLGVGIVGFTAGVLVMMRTSD
ncbi:MAG: ABC transporter permease [bacterium]|nr:ABC transporter permease [bacterium]